MAFRTAPPRPPKFQGKLPSLTSLAPCRPVNHTHSAPGAEAPCRTASLSQPGSGLTARANHGSLTQLLAQAPHGLWLAAHAQERTLGIGALLQHRAGGEDLPAQFLRRPGKEELGLDEAPLEERDQRLASRERAHQGGLARVRVSDERHAGETLALPPPGALRLVLEAHSVELFLQLGDAVADLAPVELAVRLAAAASAGAAAPPVLRPGLLGGFAHPRRHVAQARDLDLRARVARARVPVKDFEDYQRAVHHLAADLLREVELLRGRNLVVDEDDVHGVLLTQEAQLLPLPGPEIRPRLDPRALLRE